MFANAAALKFDVRDALGSCDKLARVIQSVVGALRATAIGDLSRRSWCLLLVARVSGSTDQRGAGENPRTRRFRGTGVAGVSTALWRRGRRVSTPRAYPGRGVPRHQGVRKSQSGGAVQNRLLSAPFEFVLTQSFLFLSKGAGQGLLQRQIHRMKNAGDYGVSQTAQLTRALDALTGNEFVMGEHHFSLQVLTDIEAESALSDSDRLGSLNEALARAKALLADTGMAVAREDLALEAAFWAQLPGNFSLRPRKAPLTSRNFAAMSSFHNYPTGRLRDNHWGDALATFMTSARSAYHFSLHAGHPTDSDGGAPHDTGHTFICGPTGSGKTVLVAFLVAMLARRSTTQFVFDKDRGLEILIRAVGGQYFSLRAGVQPG